jgi:hypothetical protein
MASDPNRSDADYVAKARELYQQDGEIEVDDGAVVSRNDDRDSSHGAYVQAWVWVDDDRAEDDFREEDD